MSKSIGPETQLLNVRLGKELTRWTTECGRKKDSTRKQIQREEAEKDISKQMSLTLDIMLDIGAQLRRTIGPDLPYTRVKFAQRRC